MWMKAALVRQVAGLPLGFWWLWTSTLVNRLGTFVFPFLTLYLTSTLGYSATHAGLVLAVYGAGASLGALLGGELTDRIGRRATMVGAQGVAAVATLLLGLATRAPAIASLAFVVGAASSAVRPAVSAMLVDLVTPQDRVRAFALNYWAINLGFAFSAAVAGLLIRNGYLWLFAGNAAATLLCALVMWVRLPETRATAVRATAGTGPRSRIGLGSVLRDGRFMLLCLLGFAMWMMLYQGASSLPVALAEHGIGAQQYGLVIALNGILIVALQLPLTAVLKGRRRGPVLALSAAIVGAGFGINGFAGRSLALYAMSVVVWTLGEVAYNPALSASVADFSHDRTRGRYQGVFNFGTSLAAVLAPLAGGLLLDHWGGPALWCGCLVLGAATAAGFWTLLARRRTATYRREADVRQPSTAGPGTAGWWARTSA